MSSKAQERSRYEIGGQSIEVLGAGRFVEGKLECWNPAGERDQALTAMVESALAKKKSPQVRLVPGKKNRVVIIREVSGQRTAPFYNISLNGYAKDQWWSSQERLALKMVSDPGNSSVTRTTLFGMAADHDESQLMVRFTETSMVGDERTVIKNEQGASASVGEARFILRSIEKAKPVQGQLAQWQVRIAVEKTDDIQVIMSPLDAKGQPIRGVDANGQPNDPWRRQEYNPVPPKGVGKSIPATGGGGGNFISPSLNFQPNKIGEIVLPFTLDPRTFKTLSVFGNRHRQLTLGPIALDPR